MGALETLTETLKSNDLFDYNYVMGIRESIASRTYTRHTMFAIVLSLREFSLESIIKACNTLLDNEFNPITKRKHLFDIIREVMIARNMYTIDELSFLFENIDDPKGVVIDILGTIPNYSNEELKVMVHKVSLDLQNKHLFLSILVEEELKRLDIYSLSIIDRVLDALSSNDNVVEARSQSLCDCPITFTKLELLDAYNECKDKITNNVTNPVLVEYDTYNSLEVKIGQALTRFKLFNYETIKMLIDTKLASHVLAIDKRYKEQEIAEALESLLQRFVIDTSSPLKLSNKPRVRRDSKDLDFDGDFTEKDLLKAKIKDTLTDSIKNCLSESERLIKLTELYSSIKAGSSETTLLSITEDKDLWILSLLDLIIETAGRTKETVEDAIKFREGDSL